MQITVKVYGSNEQLTFTYEPSETILQLKSNIEKQTRISVADQILYYKEERLEDSETLAFYNVSENELLELRTVERQATNSKKSVKGSRSWGLNKAETPYFRHFRLKIKDLLPDGYENIEAMKEAYEKVQEVEPENDLCYYRIQTDNDLLNCMDISVDNRFIVTGFGNGLVKISDLQRRVETCELLARHSKELTNVKITRDNKFVVTSSMDGCIKVFDIDTQRQIHNFKDVHPEGVTSFALSSDNEYIYSCSVDKSVKILNIKTESLKETMTNYHDARIECIALSEDNNYMATGSHDKSIKIFDLTTNHVVAHIKNAHKKIITAMALSKDGSYLASGSSDGSIKIFEVETGAIFHEFKHANLYDICSIVISDDNKYVIVADANLIIVFNLKSKVELHCFENNGKNTALAISSSNKYLAVGSVEGLRVFNFEASIRRAIVSPQDKYVILGSAEGSIIILDFKTKSRVHSFEKVHGDTIHTLLVTKNNKYLISGSSDKSIKKFDLETKMEIPFLQDIHQNAITSIALSNDDKYLVSCSKDRSIKMFEVASGKEIYNFINTHFDDVLQVKFTPDNNYIVSASKDRSVKMFDLSSKTDQIDSFQNCLSNDILEGHLVAGDRYVVSEPTNKSLKASEVQFIMKVYHFKDLHQEPIRAFAVTNSHIISGSADGSLKLLSVKKKAEIHHFKGHDPINEVSSMNITQNGKYVLVGYSDGAIKIFNIDTKFEVYCWDNCHSGSVESLSLSAANEYVISTCSNSTIKMHTFPLSDKPGVHEHNKSSLNTSLFLFSRGLRNIVFGKILDQFTCRTFCDYYISQHHWNILHILSIKSPYDIYKLPSYTDFKVSFLVDAYGKTPLHYLLAYADRDFQAINTMFKYIVNFLEDPKRTLSEREQILNAQSGLFLFIISKLNQKDMNKYLKLCVVPTPSRNSQPLPQFGWPIKNYTTTDRLEVDAASIRAEMLTDDEHQVVFKSLLIHCDYDVRSEDMSNTVAHLVHMRNEDLFTSPAIKHLVNALWEQAHRSLLVMGVIYTILVVFVSISHGTEEPILAIEILILALTGVFIFGEALQLRELGLEYFGNLWNCLDLGYLLFLFGFTLAMSVKDDIDQLLQDWLSAFVYTLCYLRWLTYLRLFDPTRYLIQMVKCFIQDMLGYLIMLVVLNLGFALVFYNFRYDVDYSVHLYETYLLLFGEYHDLDYNVAQKILLVFFLFIFNIIFVNMLISVMIDSFAKTQETKVLTDSRMRLDMIQENIILMSLFLPKQQEKKGYLVFCGVTQGDDDDFMNSDWEGRDKIIMKIHKQSNLERTQENKQIKKEIAQMKQELAQVKKDINQEFDTKLRNEVEQVRVQIDQSKDMFDGLYAKLGNEVTKLKKDVRSKIEGIKTEEEKLMNKTNKMKANMLEDIKALETETLENLKEMKGLITKLHPKKR